LARWARGRDAIRRHETQMTQSQGKPSFLRRNARAIVASIALTAVFAFIMRAGALPVLPPEGTLARLAGLPALGFALAMIASMLLKYGRVHFLIAPVARIPLRRVMNIGCIAMALITFLPMRLGEFARPAMLRERGKVSGWAMTATVGAERIIDGVVFGLVLLAGLAFAPPHDPVPDHIGNLPVPAALVPRAAVSVTALFGVALVVMMVFYWRRELARSITERVLGIVSKKLADKLVNVVVRLSEGLQFLTNVRYSGPYVVVTLLSVLANVWAVQLLAAAAGVPGLGFAEACTVLGVLAIGFALPNAPGFFGAVQLSLYAGLALYVAPEMITREGAGFVFVYYVGYLGVVVLLALVGLVLEYAVPGAPAPEQQAG
jgi:hypothetical protein